MTLIGLGCLLLMTVSACSPGAFTQTPFVRQAQDAASSLSAAAATIEYVHTGKVDDRYARSSLSIYRQSLQGMESELPGLRGAPDETVLQPVISQLERARQVLDDPCLDDDCDWRAQLSTLDDASRALLKVSE